MTKPLIVPFIGGPAHGERFYFTDPKVAIKRSQIEDEGGVYRLVSLPHGNYYYMWNEDLVLPSLTGGSAQNHTPSLPSVTVPD